MTIHTNLRALTLRQHQRGFSLIELMIALAIGILLMASVLMIIVSASQSGRVSDAETAMNEEGIIVLGLLQQQIRLAGYSNMAISGTNSGKNFDGTSIRGCDYGFSDPKAGFASLACKPASAAVNSAIAIRYEADVLNTVPVGSPARPSNCQMEGITADTPSAAASAVASAADFALADNRYYVTTSGTGSGRPELYCVGATSNTNYSGTPQPLIENIEQIKYTYGIVASTDPADKQIVTYYSANDIDSNYSSESALERWKRVASVKICVLMRSAEPTRDNSVSSGTYKDCDGATQTANDGYMRRAYITTAQLRNKASVPLEKL